MVTHVVVCQHSAWCLAHNRSSANICCKKEWPWLGRVWGNASWHFFFLRSLSRLFCGRVAWHSLNVSAQGESWSLRLWWPWGTSKRREKRLEAPCCLGSEEGSRFYSRQKEKVCPGEGTLAPRPVWLRKEQINMEAKLKRGRQNSPTHEIEKNFIGFRMPVRLLGLGSAAYQVQIKAINICKDYIE